MSGDGRLRPFFLEGLKGPLFALYFEPDGKAMPAPPILHVPALAEEMNLSRPLVARTARALCAAGHSVLLLDVYGTGDSAGDFEEARVDIWVDDLRRGAAWLCSETGAPVPDLWSCRGGALLAGRLAQALLAPPRLLAWAPVASGRRWVDRLLRLLLLAGNTGEGGNAGGPRARLAGEGAVPVAGYVLTQQLAGDLDSLELPGQPPARLGSVRLLDVSHGAGTEPTPAITRLRDGLARAADGVEVQTLSGPPFWSAHEDVAVPGLLEETLRFFDEHQLAGPVAGRGG